MYDKENDKMFRRVFMARSADVTTAIGSFLRLKMTAAENKNKVPRPCDIRSGTIRLSCGRRLGYAEMGSKYAPHTVLYNHGFPDCRLEVGILFGALSKRFDVRLIALDRPGIGLSDVDKSYTYETWPKDVLAAANTLGIARFGVIGVSQGGPYALATARALPDRVTAVSLCCSIAPFEAVTGEYTLPMKLSLRAAKHPLEVAILFQQLQKSIARNPAWITPVVRSAADVDRTLLADPVVRDAAAQVIVEALRRGSTGMVRGMALATQSWASWLKDVTQKVSVFHGCADRWAPPVMGRFLVEHLPHAKGHFIKGEGHMTLPYNHCDSILGAATLAV